MTKKWVNKVVLTFNYLQDDATSEQIDAQLEEDNYYVKQMCNQDNIEWLFPNLDSIIDIETEIVVAGSIEVDKEEV